MLWVFRVSFIFNFGNYEVDSSNWLEFCVVDEYGVDDSGGECVVLVMCLYFMFCVGLDVDWFVVIFGLIRVVSMNIEVNFSFVSA